MSDLEIFATSLSDITAAPLALSEMSDAFQNLTSFMSLLIKVNEREQVVATKQRKKRNEN